MLPVDETKVMHCLIEDGVPEVAMVGIVSLQHARHPIPDHVHPGVMEICYLHSGQITWTVGSQDFVQKGNEIFFTWPDERHGTGGRPLGKGFLYWMQLVLPREPQPFLGLSERHAAQLISRLWQLPSRHFQGKRHLAKLFTEIVQLHLDSQRRDELETLAILSKVQSLLLTVIECARLGRSGEIEGDIGRIVEHIVADPVQSPPSRELARMAHLSLSRFNHKFKEQTGASPAEFILRQKVERARRLLTESDLPITQIAMDLGFSSSQYFATVFRRFTMLSPRSVRRAGREVAGE